MPTKPNTIDFIEFPAENSGAIRKAKSFYSKVFGWSFTDWDDHYADTSNSGVGSGFNAGPEHRRGKPLAVIYASDLQLARKNVILADGKITKDIFSFPGGRRFHFKGPAGNELAVWPDK